MLELTSDLDQEPCVPRWNESDRLAAIERYAILDSGREDAFDDVAMLAADILEAPIALVNFIGADRQWFKAEIGIGTDTLPLEVSICRHAILQPGVLVVADLAQDNRFGGNPLIHVADGLRFKEKDAVYLKKTLDTLKTRTPVVPLKGKNYVFAQPTLIAEIEFRGWTDNGNHRHASHRGLREIQDNAAVYELD